MLMLSILLVVLDQVKLPFLLGPQGSEFNLINKLETIDQLIFKLQENMSFAMA